MENGDLTYIPNRRIFRRYKFPDKQPDSMNIPLVQGPTKFFPIHYKTPTRLDMAVILVFFNPAQSMRMIQNLLTVKYYIEAANIPLYIGELAFDENPFLFKAAGNIFQFRSTSYMFYKENLIRTVEMKIPKIFKKMCVLDADILFDTPLWYSIVSTTLDRYPVCQAYNRVHSLGIDYCYIEEEASAKPGYAFAFRRNGYTPHKDEGLINTSPVHTESCDLSIYHLYHGNHPANSLQEKMTELMTSLNISSFKKMLSRNTDNILEWKTPYKAAANKLMQAYFWNRFDDGVGISSSAIKFFPEPYDTPRTKDMAIILVFFNPAPYCRILQNILTIRHMLESAKIPYYIAEMVFDDKPFLFKAEANVAQFRSNSYMFYKENLIRVVERIIPASFTKLCIMDADVIFDKPNWYHIVSNTLNRVEVCQPFKMCYWLDLEYKVMNSRTNCIDSNRPEIDWATQHPGFVWAFHRSWAGLLPYLNVDISIIGGDTLLYYIIKNNSDRSSSLYKFEKIKIPSYDSCSLSLYHLNHGSHVKRKYYDIVKETATILKGYGLTHMGELVYCRDDGIIEWKPKYVDDMNRFMKQYFRDRQEDNP